MVNGLGRGADQLVPSGVEWVYATSPLSIIFHDNSNFTFICNIRGAKSYVTGWQPRSKLKLFCFMQLENSLPSSQQPRREPAESSPHTYLSFLYVFSFAPSLSSIRVFFFPNKILPMFPMSLTLLKPEPTAFVQNYVPPHNSIFSFIYYYPWLGFG